MEHRKSVKTLLDAIVNGDAEMEGATAYHVADLIDTNQITGAAAKLISKAMSEPDNKKAIRMLKEALKTMGS